jgi:hypothetical protein
VQHTHYTKPEMPSIALMMLVLWTSVMAFYTRKMQTTYAMYVLSGIFTGAAATVRYNAAAIGIVLFLTGLILLWRQRTWQMLVTIAVSWILVPFTFFIGTPFALLNFSEFYRQFQHITGQFLTTGDNIAAIILTTPQQGFLILLRYLIEYGIGIPATVAIFIGIYAAWRNRPKPLMSDKLKVLQGSAISEVWRKTLQPLLQYSSELLLVMLLVPFIAAYMFVTMRTVRPIFSDNLLVLIVPQCLILSAIGAGWLYENVRLPKTFLAPTIALVLLIIPLMRTIPMVSLISHTETRARMQDWIHVHIPAGSRFLLLEAYNVPLDPAIYPYDQNFNINNFHIADAADYDYWYQMLV